MGADHCILGHIASIRRFREKINICGFSNATYIIGNWKDLKRFSEMLYEEARGEALLPFPLATLVCRQINYDLQTHQGGFGRLPVELLEKIEVQAAFCLNPKGT